MAKTFKPFTSEGSSWADDDDDIDVALPIAPLKLPEVAEKDQPEEEAPARDHHRGGDDHHRGARHDRDDRHHDNHRGGAHDDRRRDRDYNERRGGGGGGYSDRPKNPLPDHPPFKLYVGNLSFHSIEDDIADFFGDHDTILNIVLPVDHVSNRPKGFAYVEFSTREALERALTLDGRALDRREIRLDVASERPARQDRSSNFFEKREGRSRGNDRERPAPAQRERPQFSLLPRSASATESSDDTKKPSIFGEAKPRDEAAYLERQKARELERKQAKELERKQAKEAKELARKKSIDEVKVEGGEKKQQGPPSRKNSHDDGHGFRAGGGRGTRGGRGERPGRGDSRGRGGEHGGRGGEHGGRGGGQGAAERRGSRDAPHAAKKEAKKEAKQEPEAAVPTPTPTPASRRKSEPRAKRTEPAKVKITAPAPAKVVNAFAALDVDDSDSD